DAKARHPVPVQLIEPPLRGVRGSDSPDTRCEDEIDAARNKRDPPRQLRAPARCEPGENAGCQQNANEPDQDHKNTAIANNSTEPAAIPAVYQRTRPVSVWLSSR